MNWIVRFRYVILGIFVLLFIVAIILFSQVTINYDNTKYLPEDRPTKQALVVLDEEFGINGYAEVMVTNVTVAEALSLASELAQIPEIQRLDFNPASPDYYQAESALFQITFIKDNYDESTKAGIEKIQVLLDSEDYYLGGESVQSIRYSEVIQEEILKIIAILLPIIIFILFLTTSSWIDPLLFLIVVAISVIINMGSNVFFPSISYMTHATCGILQLALCMDYSVMILHSFRKNLNGSNDPKTAVVKAVKESFVPIMGSALTTVVGFVALMFMRYQIGFDIGVVLVKGTLISLAVSLLLMPGLIIMFAPLIKKTEHRSLIKPRHRIVKFLFKTKFVLPIIALAAISGAIYLQGQNTYAYGEMAIASESGTVAESQNQINAVFGNRNNFVILVPKDEIAKELQLIQTIGAYTTSEGITSKQMVSVTMFYVPFGETEFQSFLSSYGLEEGMVSQMMGIFGLMEMQTGGTSFSIMEMGAFIQTTELLTNEQKAALAPFLSQISQTVALLVSDNFHRLTLTVDLATESEATFEFVAALRAMTNEVFPDQYYLVGESAAIYDMKEVVEDDYLKSTLITIILVFLIIMISFRSFSVPIILVLLIQGAIWINMAIPALTGRSILYIGYIIVSCIQLGSTIDYGILYANRYLDHRKTKPVQESVFLAYEETKTTVLTSGLILIGAGYVLGWSSSIPSIAVFGTLIGRGAVISTILVLFILPQVMMIFDKFIQKTTIKKASKA